MPASFSRSPAAAEPVVPAHLAQEPVVVALGDAAGASAQLGVDGFVDELFDDPPTHADMAAVLDNLACEHALELRVGEGLGKPLHPAELDDLGTEVECGDADRVR